MDYSDGLNRHLRNFICFCIGFLIAAVPMLSHAETTAATSGTGWKTPLTGAQVFSTTSAACTAFCNVYGAGNAVTSCGNGSDFNQQIYCSAGGNYQGLYSSSTLTCPDASWTLSGTTCTRPDCDSGTTRQADGSCKSSCTSGETSSASRYTGTFTTSVWDVTVGNRNPIPSSLCDGKCSGSITGPATNCWGQGIASRSQLKAGVPVLCGYTITLTGDSCSGATDGVNGTPSTYDPCYGQGKVSGTVNGVTVCSGTATTNQTSSGTGTGTSTNKDASGTTTGSSATGEETTKSTTCDGTTGKCTTDTTTKKTNADGTTTTTTKSDTQDKTSFCEQNPTLTICKTSNFTDAACTAGAPTCDGDAVQCAQANQAWKLRCNLETEPTDDAFKLGKSLAGGGSDPKGDPLSADKESKISILDIVSGAASQRSLASSCISSPSFTALGRTYTIDTTNFCRFAEICGFMMVAVSSILAIRMVTSGA